MLNGLQGMSSDCEECLTVVKAITLRLTAPDCAKTFTARGMTIRDNDHIILYMYIQPYIQYQHIQYIQHVLYII